MAPSPSSRPTPRRVLVGLFVVWQLLYLLASNVLPMLPHGEPDEDELTDSRTLPGPLDGDGPVQIAINRAAGVTDFWGQTTGQVQIWSLFAPGVPKQSTFPLVELRWHSSEAGAPATAEEVPPPVQLLSSLEPADPYCYLRLPGSEDRLFHYEVRLGLIYLDWDEKMVADYPQVWSEAIAHRVRRQWKSIRAYLNWRAQQFAEEHPELPPPSEVLLRMRIFRANRGAGETPAGQQGRRDACTSENAAPTWEGPFEPPLARWRPDLEGSADFLPVEAWNPTTASFVRLPRKGQKT